jgi:aryl-alcohol dehydrogenase-like predicted oxidoreductase
MDYATLGRTGMSVSVMGMGCGGPSRVGRNTGRTEQESIGVVRAALDAGVNFIDTAQSYKTEEIVGKAIKGRERESIHICTKIPVSDEMTVQSVRDGLDMSLDRLDTNYIDVFMFHGLQLGRYTYVADEIMPEMRRLKQEGRIRAIGASEMFGGDRQHHMLQRALADDLFDVVMVGYNLLNHEARRSVFPLTIKKNVGVLVMFAVRRAMSDPARMKEVMADLADRGKVDPGAVDLDDPFGFMVHEGGATSIPDAAYRFCRYEPGVHVVLSGTGNSAHLARNVQSLESPPLPREDVERAYELFAGVDDVTGG